MRARSLLAARLILTVLVGCSSSPIAEEHAIDPNTPIDAGAGDRSGNDGGASTDASTSTCTGATAVCTAWNERATCGLDNGSVVWTKSTCPAGQGCVRGECVVGSCSDDCALGESGCDLKDIGGASRSPDASKLHDRARLFEKWIRFDTKSLFHGQIVSVKYTDASRATVSSVYIGDSALHTGTYLAGEAHRLIATGSPQARKNVRELVDFNHVLFNISGDPGMLATSAFPAGDADLRAWTGWDCSAFDRHCNVSYGGKSWDYVGQPSRDMYVGPLLGLVAAYDALGTYDEEWRKLIRQDLVNWAKEMIKERTVSVVVKVNGIPLPAQQVKLRFFIPETAGMENGSAVIEVPSLSELTDLSIGGGRDFMPNPSVLLRKFSLLSSIPDIPRYSSALLVGGIINAALHVTDGVADYAADRAALLDFHLNNADEWGNAKSWIELAKGQPATEHSCEKAYFGTHIMWAATYSWGLLEQDPSTRQSLFGDVIDPRIWPDLQTHKNSFFSFGYGAMKPGGLTSTPLADATRQVTLFPAPPRIRAARTGGCSTNAAVDIDQRPVVYDSWHSNPWDTSDDANTRQTYPGHDYVLAYWMGRSNTFIEEDTAPYCLRR